MSSRRLYLRDAQPGDVVDDVFVISGKQFAASSNGKYYIKAFISDKTAQLTSRKWDARRETFTNLPESGFVRIAGRVENYQNNLQLIIENFFVAKDGTFDVGELLPHTIHDIPQMLQKVKNLLGSIRSKALKSLIDAYLADEKLMADFAKAPAAQTFHHAYIGGLLEHTLSAMEVADAAVKFYPKLSRDLVLAGIFLHDIAKTWELNYDCAFGYSDGGYLVGHIVKSAMWVEHKAIEAEEKTGEKIPQPLIDVVQHIILSHHGELEFGAAKTPATPEAIFVHYIENLDAKMMMSLSATRSDDVAGEGNWTEYMKAFNGRLYRPDVCAGDVEIPFGKPAETAQTPQATSEADKPAGEVKITNPLFESIHPKKR
jgi:3'-5' exoribonuclease